MSFPMTDRFPLLTQLLRSSQRQTQAFHTPGHKQGQGILAELREAWGMAVFRADLPELAELDNLLAPVGVLAEAQSLAAETFQADRTWFLVNGSTVGIMAAILAITGQPPGKIILPRTVHRSAITGLILSGAQPIFVNPTYYADWNLVGTIAPAQIEIALAQHPDSRGVFIVSPTYEGLCADLPTIAQICHQAGVPLVVDEAHGAHFGFHPQLPPRAVDCGADVSIQSTHKTLSALTQAAMLHLRGSRVESDRIQTALNLLQTTSPSYLLLASLDAARYQMASQGAELWETTINLAHRTRQDCRSRLHLPVLDGSDLEGSPRIDPIRLTIAIQSFQQSGFALDQALNDRFGVIAELVTLEHLTFLFGLGQTQEDSDRLLHALAELLPDEPLSPTVQPIAIPPFVWTDAPTLPALSPREAHFAPVSTVPLAAAIGRMSAELICPYPPGIPVLLPGEVISRAALDFLQTLQRSGGILTGNTDPTLQTLKVIAI